MIETLQVFIAENGDHNHILTGKNPRNYMGLFELLCRLMWRK
ncbi:hypothetical protein [Paenibacillus sp. FSL R10-2734]